MKQLDVLNNCLGTMGEAPLNAIDDAHTYRGAILSILNTVNREYQARGWWFNRELLTIQVGGLDSAGYLPGDTINVRMTEGETRKLVQRGRRLYDVQAGSYVIDSQVKVILVRLVPFEDTPELFAAYVAAETVLRFQKRYDGDSTKTRQLNDEQVAARVAATAEEIRQVGANLITENPRLQQIKRVVSSNRVIPR